MLSLSCARSPAVLVPHQLLSVSKCSFGSSSCPPCPERTLSSGQSRQYSDGVIHEHTSVGGDTGSMGWHVSKPNGYGSTAKLQNLIYWGHGCWACILLYWRLFFKTNSFTLSVMRRTLWRRIQKWKQLHITSTVQWHRLSLVWSVSSTGFCCLGFFNSS